jgi:hypothetical protein
MFHEKQERALKLVPEISSLRKFEKEKEDILKFRGYSGVKTVMNDLLKTCKKGDEYLIFGSENQISKRMPIFAQIFVARKDKKKLRARILMRVDLVGKKMSK